MLITFLLFTFLAVLTDKFALFLCHEFNHTTYIHFLNRPNTVLSQHFSMLIAMKSIANAKSFEHFYASPSESY